MVNDCQVYFGFDLPSVIIDRQSKKFLSAKSMFLTFSLSQFGPCFIVYILYYQFWWNKDVQKLAVTSKSEPPAVARWTGNISVPQKVSPVESSWKKTIILVLAYPILIVAFKSIYNFAPNLVLTYFTLQFFIVAEMTYLHTSDSLLCS